VRHPHRHAVTHRHRQVMQRMRQLVHTMRRLTQRWGVRRGVAVRMPRGGQRGGGAGPRLREWT
jgi:hypothetical protein